MKFETYCEKHTQYTSSQNAYRYCKYIKDSKKIRQKITCDIDLVKYCLHVKDRKLIRNKIEDSLSAYLYCRFIEHRQTIRKKILNKSQIRKLDLYLSGENPNEYRTFQLKAPVAA